MKRTRYKKVDHQDYIEETWNERVSRTEERGRDTCKSCSKPIEWLPFGAGNGKCACSYWRYEDIVEPKTYRTLGHKKVKSPYMDRYCMAINNGAVFRKDPYPEFWGEIQFEHNKHLCKWVMERCKGAPGQVNTSVMML